MTPWKVAHQLPPSMGFSRQEYWSGLPFASPGNLPDRGIEPKSPTLQADFTVSKVKVALSCQILCDPKHYTVHGIFQARILEWAAFPFSRGVFPTQRLNPGIKHRSPALQADSIPADPPGKPKNTEVGSLSLLQRNFLTQESSWGLLHCRRIVYQLSYQGSTCLLIKHTKCLKLCHVCKNECCPLLHSAS